MHLDAVTEFFDENWVLYQKIINNDYLGHRALFAAARDLLLERFARPYTFLDLGCGDGTVSIQAIQGTSIARYVGVDLADVALEQARKNLEVLPCPKTFHLGDAFEPIPGEDVPFDVALASFSLHHLLAPQKAAFLSGLHPRLATGGAFILIDILGADSENREQAVHRFLDEVGGKWTALTPHEMDLVVQHVSGRDFPTAWPILQADATAAGFSRSEVILREENDLHGVVAFWA
jgi:ubiquinone/menaquinone biosynthesis C-methylase UbiE